MLIGFPMMLLLHVLNLLKRNKEINVEQVNRFRESLLELFAHTVAQAKGLHKNMCSPSPRPSSEWYLVGQFDLVWISTRGFYPKISNLTHKNITNYSNYAINQRYVTC